jgi:hypothetical protein
MALGPAQTGCGRPGGGSVSDVRANPHDLFVEMPAQIPVKFASIR